MNLEGCSDGSGSRRPPCGRVVIWVAWACTPDPGPYVLPAPPSKPEPTAPIWPAAGTVLNDVPWAAPRNLPDTTLFLMAGHANGDGKDGNVGSFGQSEADVNRWTAEQVAMRLERMDRFSVVLGRRGGERPSYGARIRHAERVGADVFIELHTDSRSGDDPWARRHDQVVWRSHHDVGFSVLYNEGGLLGAERASLGRAVATAMTSTGLPPYPAYNPVQYQPDPEVVGVHIDRRGLMMLRRPSMPSIIIETHNAKDPGETLRWRESRTLDVFANALAEGVRQYRTPTGP